jgi:hypothetical protein
MVKWRPWGMFLHADQIVKAVMIGLAVASLVTWTVWVACHRRLAARPFADRGQDAGSRRDFAAGRHFDAL